MWSQADVIQRRLSPLGSAVTVARPGQRTGLARWYRPLIVGLAFGGAIFGTGSVLSAYAIGMWPPHDTSAYWLAGRHLIEGTAVYGGGSSWYLAFLYSPPVAVLMVLPGLLHYDLVSLALVGLQLLALRYITGSWLVTAMLGWIPWVHHEFVAGNVDCLMAATIYAAVRNKRGTGVALAIFAFAKFSPALLLVRASRRQWIELTVTAVILLALTLPFMHMWPEWIAKLAIREPYTGVAPLIVRLPLVAVLLLYRRPWAVAAAAPPANPLL